MKKEYRKPETEVTRFETVDVITTSGMNGKNQGYLWDLVDPDDPRFEIG